MAYYIGREPMPVVMGVKLTYQITLAEWDAVAGDVVKQQELLNSGAYLSSEDGAILRRRMAKEEEDYIDLIRNRP